MRRLSQLLTTAALLLTATVLVKADNPVFHMEDPGTGLPINALGFSFQSNNTGGGFLDFTNESGFDWFGLLVQVTQPTETTIDCSGGPFFSDCLISSITQGGSTSFSLNFSSRLKQTGIANGENFSINLNNLINGAPPQDPGGAGSWQPLSGVVFTAQVTDYLQATPEPVTCVLVLIGGLMIISAKRVFKQV